MNIWRLLWKYVIFYLYCVWMTLFRYVCLKRIRLMIDIQLNYFYLIIFTSIFSSGGSGDSFCCSFSVISCFFSSNSCNLEVSSWYSAMYIGGGSCKLANFAFNASMLRLVTQITDSIFRSSSASGSIIIKSQLSNDIDDTDEDIFSQLYINANFVGDDDVRDDDGWGCGVVMVTMVRVNRFSLNVRWYCWCSSKLDWGFVGSAFSPSTAIPHFDRQCNSIQWNIKHLNAHLHTQWQKITQFSLNR